MNNINKVIGEGKEYMKENGHLFMNLFERNNFNVDLPILVACPPWINSTNNYSLIATIYPDDVKIHNRDRFYHFINQ